MAALVPIPWQPYYWLRPATLTLLERASARVGEHLYLYKDDPRGLLSAWRSYAKQDELYQDYIHNGGPPVSNPNTGQRSHMRGAAFDLVRQDAAAQNACRAVGLVRDLAEPWHWNHPRWFLMPIIKSNTAAIGADVHLLTNRQDDNMANLAIVQDNGYTAYLVDWANREAVGPLGPKTVEALRSHKPKHQGPLSLEFEWDKSDFTRIRTYLNVKVAPPELQS